MDKIATERSAAAAATASPLRNGGSEAENAVGQRPIHELVQEIAAYGKASDDRMICAAMLLRELRARFKDGEMGKRVKWRDWIEKEIDLAPTQIFLLNAIAEADDPRQELERQRALICKRVQKHRQIKQAKQAGAKTIEPERRDLASWAHDAPIEDVRRIARQARELDDQREAGAVAGTPSSAAPPTNSHATVSH